MSVHFGATMAHLEKLGYSPKKILDIGCNSGMWTRQMQAWFPHSEFVMIDATDYPKTTPAPFIHTVLCDKEGFVDWYDIQGTGDSYFKENSAHYKNIQSVKRECTTLDTLFKNKILDNQFDFVKIDVQGAEIDILKGATLFIPQIEVLLMEVPFATECNKNAPNFLDYISYLDKIGFTVYDIIECHKHHGIMAQIDILFVKKESQIHINTQFLINRFGEI